MTDFDGAAGMVAARVMAVQNADMERAALDMVGPADGERLLVIGFGPGVGLTALLDRAAPARVLAVDPSAAMTRIARRRLASRGGAGAVELLTAPASGIPPSDQYDAAVSVNTQQLWRPHLDSLAAIAAVLRSGGRLVTITHGWAIERHHPLARWRELVEADLAATGFAQWQWSQASYRTGPGLALRASR